MKFYGVVFAILIIYNLNCSASVKPEMALEQVREKALTYLDEISTVESVEGLVQTFENNLYKAKKDLEWSTDFFNQVVAEFRKVLVDAKMQQWLDEIDQMDLATQKLGVHKIPITVPMIREEILKFRTKNFISLHLKIYDPLVKRFEERLKDSAIPDYNLNPDHPRTKPLSLQEQDDLRQALSDDQAMLSELKKIEKVKRLVLESIEEKINALQAEPSSIASKLFLHVLFTKISEQKLSEKQILDLQKFAEKSFNQAIRKKFSLDVHLKTVKINPINTVVPIDSKEKIPNKIQISIDNFIDDEMSVLPEKITGSMLNDMFRRINQHLKLLAKQDNDVYKKLFEYAKPIVHSKLDERVETKKLIGFQ